jgi:hypothetical protein
MSPRQGRSQPPSPVRWERRTRMAGRSISGLPGRTFPRKRRSLRPMGHPPQLKRCPSSQCRRRLPRRRPSGCCRPSRPRFPHPFATWTLRKPGPRTRPPTARAERRDAGASRGKPEKTEEQKVRFHDDSLRKERATRSWPKKSRNPRASSWQAVSMAQISRISMPLQEGASSRSVRSASSRRHQHQHWRPLGVLSAHRVREGKFHRAVVGPSPRLFL